MNRRNLVLSTAFVAIGSRVTVAAQTPEPAGYAHPEWFADPAWLAQQLGRDDLSIVALTPEDDFASGHIPGAAQIDWPALEIIETDEASIEIWQGEVESILTELGIERTDTVVVYDGGTFWAGRLWWILHFLGHEDVRVLNGGLQAWTANGGDLETGTSATSPADEPYQGTPEQDVIVTLDEALSAFDEGAAIFVDARSAGEFADGRIPGAINVPFTDNAVDGDPRFWKSPEELVKMYEAAGITPDRRVIPYCTTGVRSAVTYFTLRQLGYENVALFTGSFAEWSADPERPVERD